MHASLYLRLIVLTAGTLLPFFWIVVILGHRRQRNFERVFFFLCLALIFSFGGSLLALNAQLYYSTVPSGLALFTWTVVCVGLWFLPSLLVHLHIEYAHIRGLIHSRTRKLFWLAIAYLPPIVLLLRLYTALSLRSGIDFVLPTQSLGLGFQIWLVCSVLIAMGWQWQFMKIAAGPQQRSFHKSSVYIFAQLALWLLVLPMAATKTEDARHLWTVISAMVICLALAPLAAMIKKVQHLELVQIGRQRNLAYAVFVTFLALLYLGFTRRVGQWLEPYLPPEATAGILLFLPVVFFEPLQRMMKRTLQRTAQTELDRAQHMMRPIQEVARLGNLAKLRSFIEDWTREQLELAEVTLSLDNSSIPEVPREANEEIFSIQQSGRVLGSLRVKAHGAMLSGETVAALELLCEQLPPALDLCRLIEEKLALERELAERERMALVGQMAASISHNLKNPLGSIKTILQVQMENEALPEEICKETRIVLEEIRRLNGTINQLLQFSRPAVRGGIVDGVCDAGKVVEDVLQVMRHEAEMRGVGLESQTQTNELRVGITSEALHDVVSNLVINALEATQRGGHVRVIAANHDNECLITVEDDGAGVSEIARDKILQPFFTTKTQGTGLGLAIVAKRLADFGGRLEWESPVKNGRGARFGVRVKQTS